MMPTTLGLHNHQSSRSLESAIYLPDDVKTLPELFREWLSAPGVGLLPVYFDGTDLYLHV